MTEDEAKTKWCPFAISAVNEGSANRMVFTQLPAIGGATQAVNCISSACMMWRWDKEWQKFDDVIQATPSNTSGYCGLAGKP